MTAAPSPPQQGQANARSGPRPGGFSVLRIGLGLVLLTAAVLKGWQLGTEPTLEKGLLTSRWFLIMGVEVEWLLAVWLLSGLYRRPVWWVALGCFTVFAGISLYKTLNGEASCGCFGRLRVNPWHTLLIDLTVIGLLLLSREPRARRRRHAVEALGRQPRLALASMILVSVVLAVAGAVKMARDHSGGPSQDGLIVGKGGFIVLEPEKWAGASFPVMAYIDVQARLAQGRWVVLLYDHDCPQCQRVVPEYRHLAASATAERASAGVALIEVPPYETSPGIVPPGPALQGRLVDSFSYFVETPVVVLLSDSRVESVVSGSSISEVERMLTRMSRACRDAPGVSLSSTIERGPRSVRSRESVLTKRTRLGQRESPTRLAVHPCQRNGAVTIGYMPERPCNGCRSRVGSVERRMLCGERAFGL